MDIQEVIKKIGVCKLQAFYQFIEGRTIGVDKDGDLDYFECDVENFLSHRNRGGKDATC